MQLMISMSAGAGEEKVEGVYQVSCVAVRLDING